MTENQLWDRMISALDRRSIPPATRREIRNCGSEMFTMLIDVVSGGTENPRRTANALRLLREYCLWIELEERNAVFKLAIDACESDDIEVRGAGSDVVISLCRSHENAPDVMNLSKDLLGIAPAKLQQALDAGMTELQSDYASWFLKRKTEVEANKS